MQKFEHNGKTYVLAEEWANENRVDNYSQIDEFYPEDIDYKEYLGVSRSFAEEHEYVQEDIDTLRKAESEIADYIADRYEILFEVDENNHPVGKTDMFFDTKEVEIVDAEAVFDEFMDKLSEVEISSVDYDFDDKFLYSELADILESVQESNAETVEIIDSGVKRDDLFAFAEKLVSEAVLKENGELKDNFVHLADEYDRNSIYSNQPLNLTLNEITENTSIVQDIQDKYPVPQGFADHGVLVACHNLEEQLKEAFDIEKYDKGTGVIQADSKRFILAEDYFKDNDNNKQFRSEPALTFKGENNEEFKTLIAVDRYNEVVNPVNAYNFLNTQTNEVVYFSDLPKEARRDFAEKTFPNEIARAIAVADYNKDLKYLERDFEDFIVEKVLDRENGGLNPDFLPENVNVWNELFLDDTVSNLVDEAKKENSMLNSWIKSYEGYNIAERERFQVNADLLLEACAIVAVENRKDSLVQAFEITQADVNNLKEVFENYIDSNIIDNEEERISKAFREEINCESPEAFLESVKSILAEAVTKDETLKEAVADCKDGLTEAIISTAVFEKKEDLQHSFEMEQLYIEVDEAVYEDFKEEIESENDNLDLD